VPPQLKAPLAEEVNFQPPYLSATSRWNFCLAH